MDDQRSRAPATARANSPQRFDLRRINEALSDRLTLSEAIEVVGRIIDLYPQLKDPSKGYIGGMAKILMQYPRAAVVLAGDAVEGVAAGCAFPPVPADLIAWCRGMEVTKKREWMARLEQQVREDREKAKAQRQVPATRRVDGSAA